MKVDRSRTIGVERPGRLASRPPWLPRGLWTAMFRVRERAGSLLGLESAFRKLRFALADLALGGAQRRHNAAPSKTQQPS